MPIASLLLNKPRLVEKLREFYNYVQKNDGKVGNKTRGIDLNFNNACNLRCKYCFTNSPKGDHIKEYLDIDVIKKLADDADELGYFEFDLQGGELLLQPKKLFQVLEAIKPETLFIDGLSLFLSKSEKLNVKVVNKDVVLFRAIDQERKYSESAVIDRKSGELVHEITRNIKSENSEKDIFFYSCRKKVEKV